MIIESGVIIFIGLLLIFIKIPRKTSLKALGYPLTVDITVSVLAYAMHYGTFSGIMAAAVAGLMTSAMTSIARTTIGYYANGAYHPGKWVDYSDLFKET
jgi:hypothetical protein